MQTRLFWALGFGAVLVAACYAAFQLSPWPSALVIRAAFDKSANATSRALAKHVPPGITARLDERYDTADSDARLDVFYPSEIENGERALTTVGMPKSRCDAWMPSHRHIPSALIRRT